MDKRTHHATPPKKNKNRLRDLFLLACVHEELQRVAEEKEQGMAHSPLSACFSVCVQLIACFLRVFLATILDSHPSRLEWP